MRPLEALLLVACAVTIFAAAVPWLRRRPWAPWLLWIPIAAAAGQLLGEGRRWQMIPAYGLAAALPTSRFLRSSRLRWTAGAVSTLVFATAVVLPSAVPVFHFPEPTGSYGIGTLTYHWVDGTRPEP